jgi:polygalacturonase
MKLFVSVSLCLAATSLAAPTLPTLPTIPTRSLQATAFGVKADSATDNTTAFQNALDSIANAGGGVLHLPAAKKPYLTGPVTIGSSTDLRIDSGAVLQMLPYGTYPVETSGSYLAMITVASAHDVSISGKGTIEGNGSAWWAAYTASKIARPAMISFTKTSRILLTDFRIRNAPNVHTTFHYAITDLTMQRVNIYAPSSSPNTDGCDFEGRRALFDHDTIQNGDDNIAIQPGHDSTSDITVQDCFLGTGHGLSIGSWCNYGVRNMLCQRITFVGTTSGIRMKAGRDRGGMVRDLVYTNITMTNVQYPLYITSYYPSSPSTTAADTAAPVTATTPQWRNIQVSNMTSTSSTSGHNSVVIYALPEQAVDSLTLTNVSFTAPNAFSIQHSHRMLFTGTTYNGSATSWFGTARDTSWRKATTAVAAKDAPAIGQNLIHRGSESVLEIGTPGIAVAHRFWADGERSEIGSCSAPCTLRWNRGSRGPSWVEVDQAGQRSILTDLGW